MRFFEIIFLSSTRLESVLWHLIVLHRSFKTFFSNNSPKTGVS